MGKDIDRRDFSLNRVTDNRRAELEAAAQEVSDFVLRRDHHVRIQRVDRQTGNPGAVSSTLAEPVHGDVGQQAVDHLRAISPVLGFTAGRRGEYQLDPNIQRTSSGSAVVHLQQQHRGIAVFEASETVRFDVKGRLKAVVGTSVTIPQDTAVRPEVPAVEAARLAAAHLAEPDEDEAGRTDEFGEPLPEVSVDIAGYAPRVLAVFTERADQPTVIAGGPFGSAIKARLVWFPLGEDLRLAWELVIAMPADSGQYVAIVDAAGAEQGELLYCRENTTSVKARGNVFPVNGGGGRQMTDFPLALHEHGLPQPPGPPPDGVTGLPDDWVHKDRTEGNCACSTPAGGGTTVGKTEQGVMTFNPSSTSGNDQLVTNLFYFNCRIHDFFYLLGFREPDGNFQKSNLGRGGKSSDRVNAKVHPGAIVGTANMSTPIDGTSPTMNMGLVTRTNRHTALDSSVVYHEYTHGVTSRLVGGPLNVHALGMAQSSGMGEGWSDYIACSINDMEVTAPWVVNNPAGIRLHRYDTNFPDSYADLGKGRYDGESEHAIGEIWCATLLQMNRNIGRNLGLQLVVDALKLAPANPSFLDVRDAILEALGDLRDAGRLDQTAFTRLRNGIWAAFVRFGMGPRAKCNGASLSGIVADFQIDILEAMSA